MKLPTSHLAAALMAVTTPLLQADTLQRFDFSGEGMSTTFRISVYAADFDSANEAASACFTRIKELSDRFTDYRPTSELMALCAPGKTYPAPVSSDLLAILLRARQLAELTGGAFDPTCGHLSQLWRRAKRRGELPPPDRLEKALRVTDWMRLTVDKTNSTVTLAPGTLLDLGGVAKGYAADECLRLLRSRGLNRAVVQAGGDTAVGDAPPGAAGWEVKLRTSSKAGAEEALETVLVANCGVSTSGDLYQFVLLNGIRYSHILSPQTGLGLTERIACSVIAPDTVTSDALATAMCVLGVSKGNELAGAIPGVTVKFARPRT